MDAPYLDLHVVLWNEVGDDGLIELAKSMEEGHLVALEVLHLESNRISGLGLKALVMTLITGALPKLRVVKVSGNDFDEEHWALVR